MSFKLYDRFDALFARPQLTQVVPDVRLFIGNDHARQAETRALHGFTHVVCLLSKNERLSWTRSDFFLDGTGITEHWVDVTDSTLDPEACVNLAVALDPTLAFIEAALAGGGCVLVHCAMGVSRSATVVTAWLAARFQLTAKLALTRLRECWPRANPNRAFMAILYERWPEAS